MQGHQPALRSLSGYAAVSLISPETELTVQFSQVLKLIDPGKAFHILNHPFDYLSRLPSGGADADRKTVVPSEVEDLASVNR